MSNKKAPLTVKVLRYALSSMPDDTIVHTEQNEDFVHILASDTLLLSTSKPIGICNRSGEYVYPSVVEGYSGFCPALDEDLYAMEFTPINPKDE